MVLVKLEAAGGGEIRGKEIERIDIQAEPQESRDERNQNQEPSPMTRSHLEK
jgi:hypothetical protein